MPVNIFAYGTLMLPEIVEALTGKRFTPRTGGALRLFMLCL